MVLLFLLIIITTINSYVIELCDRFDIVHNFDNCPGVSPVEECANQGTWEHTTFTCTDPGSEVGDGNYCEYGRTNHDDCCTMREIHYIDFWFEIVAQSTWQANFFNFLVRGYSSGPFIGNVIINDVQFDDLYTVPYDNLTYISLVLDYGNTCETVISLYINGVYMVNITADNVLDISPFSSQYVMEMSPVSSNHLHFVGAHQRIPSPDKIMDLYNLGPNRSISTELCYNVSSSTLDEFISNIFELETNLTVCQNYTDYLEGELEECDDLANQCNASLIECEGKLNVTLDECFDIVICLEKNLTECQNYTEYLENELEGCNNNTNQCNEILNETQTNLTECQNYTEYLENELEGCNNNTNQCNEILNETQTNLTQCNETLNETQTNLTQCTEIIIEVIELRNNLSLCINETRRLEMLLTQSYNNSRSWLVAFIVTGSIFLVSILGYMLWLFIIPCLMGKRRRRRRRKYEEEEEEMDLFYL